MNSLNTNLSLGPTDLPDQYSVKGALKLPCSCVRNSYGGSGRRFAAAANPIRRPQPQPLIASGIRNPMSFTPISAVATAAPNPLMSL
jgi:hypothetical protein